MKGEDAVFRHRLKTFGRGPRVAAALSGNRSVMPGLGTRFKIASTRAEYEQMRARFLGRVNLDATVTMEWPFPGTSGWATYVGGHALRTSGFSDELEALCDAFGDDTVTFVGRDPMPHLFTDLCDVYPAWEVSREDLNAGYLDALLHQHGPSPDHTFGTRLDTLAATGSTGAWMVWCRSCAPEFGVVLLLRGGRPWIPAAPFRRAPIGRDVEEIGQLLAAWGMGPK
ncbi:MAG: hypothetical protein R2878_03035 [Thermoleophilia bacterium]